MRYYVYAEDGNKYGPADVQLLNHWIEEGRLLPGMMVEGEGQHHKMAAASVSELDFYVLDESRSTASDTAPAAALTYEPPIQETSQTDVAISFAMVAVTIVFSMLRGAVGVIGIFTTVLGLIAAMKAKERGNELSNVAIVMNMIAAVAWIASRVIFSLR